MKYSLLGRRTVRAEAVARLDRSVASAEHGPWRTFGRTFLTRTAVLARMSGPLCETVLDLPGAGTTLTGLARSNRLLVPLDRRGQRYRYHHLFRNVLPADPERQLRS